MNNQAIRAFCAPHTSYAPREKTDVLFRMPEGTFAYTGIIDESIKLIQDEYLTDAKTWQMFVEQFRTHPDDANLGWRGEYWGKMMRGAVLTYQYTRNKKLYACLVGAVEDMLSAQDELGRFSTYSTEFEFDGWDLWSRKYILLGFEYFLDICKSEELKNRIIPAICAHADYIMAHVGREEDGKKLITKCTRNWLGLNSSSILEPYVRLYNITGEKKYLDYAAYIVDCGGISEGNIWEMAYEDKIAPYQYQTNKAYEMMSCFEGLLEYYRVTGIEKYKLAVIRVAKRILDTDVSLIGSSGCTHELFDHSSVNQINPAYGGVVQETCVTVTWMKFCMQLLAITGDPVFADAIELSTYNAMLGAVNSYKVTDVLKGMPFDSYSPLLYSVRARATGGYQVMKQGTYGCCACIGSAGTALMAESSAMLAKDGLTVNLYIPGVITTETPEGKPLTVTVDTAYPKDGHIALRLDGAKGETFAVTVRVPAYSKKSCVKVCGKVVSEDKCGYIRLERAWADGDVIELELDVRVRTYRHEGVGENAKYHVALYKGPVVLARDARLGEQIDIPVDIAEDADGFVEVTEADADFPHEMAYKVPNKDGSVFTVVDYASAGKTWKADSLMTAWMATKNYWAVDFTKSATIASRNNHISRFLKIGENNAVEGDPAKENAVVWSFEDAGEGYYRIKAADGRYLTAKGEEADAAATLEEKLDCGCQLWKPVHFVQNRYFLMQKKSGCALYEKFGTPNYRLYKIDEGGDAKYTLDKSVNSHIETAALMEIANV